MRNDDDDDLLSDDPCTPSDSVFDQFQSDEIRYSMGEDGFPLEHDPPGDPNAPALTPENFTCLEQADGTQKCKWMIRQLIPFDDTRGSKYMRRMCTHALCKTLSGAGLQLSDSAMYACELREPPHGPSIDDLDRRDKRTMARAKSKIKWRMFRTPEEAEAGKHTLGEDEYEQGDEGADAGREPDTSDHGTAGPNGQAAPGSEGSTGRS